jgi:hypothetical protein
VSSIGERDEDVNVQQVLHSAAESAVFSVSREIGFWPGVSGLNGKPVTALMAKPWGAARSFFLTTRTVLGARVLVLVSVLMTPNCGALSSHGKRTLNALPHLLGQERQTDADYLDR